MGKTRLYGTIRSKTVTGSIKRQIPHYEVNTMNDFIKKEYIRRIKTLQYMRRNNHPEESFDKSYKTQVLFFCDDMFFQSILEELSK